jgi:hypothetical protein
MGVLYALGIRLSVFHSRGFPVLGAQTVRLAGEVSMRRECAHRQTKINVSIERPATFGSWWRLFTFLGQVSVRSSETHHHGRSAASTHRVAELPAAMPLLLGRDRHSGNANDAVLENFGATSRRGA